MRKCVAVSAAIILFLFPVFIAVAATEYKFQEGTCPTGQTWWCVTTFENGQATFAQGLNCKGDRYYYHIGRFVVSGDPTAGMTPSYTGTCDAGSIIPGWYAVVTFNDDAEPSWMGGQSCDGSYWISANFADTPVGPGGGER